jgi:HEAT repeat protein
VSNNPLYSSRTRNAALMGFAKLSDESAISDLIYLV